MELVLKAIKNIVEVNNRQIVITLPEDFNFKQVEVIVLPYLKEENSFVKNNEMNWEDITGVAEFNSDCSINHDKYISDTL